MSEEVGKRGEARRGARWALWAVLCVALAAGVWFWLRGPLDTDGREFLSAKVRMRNVETGEEVKMVRGLVEAELRGMRGQLGEDVTVGAPGPGRWRMADEGEWVKTIERINREKREVGK